MSKYRIIKEVEHFRTIYRIQKRFLWFFWMDPYDIWNEKSEIYFTTLESAKEEIKLLKCKNIKEVVYEE